MGLKILKWMLLLGLVGGGIFFAETWFSPGLKDNQKVISLNGNIEVTDAEVSFKIGGLVKERLVDEGERVTRGQPVARLEHEDLKREVDLKQARWQAEQAQLEEYLAGSRPEDIAEAKAAVEKAESERDELLAGSRPQEIAAARATVARARADMENLRVQVRRYQALWEKGVVSKEKYDQVRTDFEMAQAQVEETEQMLKLAVEGPRQEDIQQARAALREARERYNRIKKGPREETIEQQRARVGQARADLELARTRLGYTEVTAPMDGVVLSENIEPGEYVLPGTPVVTLGDLEHVWVRGFVNETDLGRVKLGQKVRVTTDTFPGKTYEGRLSFIASEAEFTPKNVQTEKERVKLVYRVKIDIHNPKMELKPGMPVDADILLESSEP